MQRNRSIGDSDYSLIDHITLSAKNANWIECSHFLFYYTNVEQVIKTISHSRSNIHSSWKGVKEGE